MIRQYPFCSLYHDLLLLLLICSVYLHLWYSSALMLPIAEIRTVNGLFAGNDFNCNSDYVSMLLFLVFLIRILISLGCSGCKDLVAKLAKLQKNVDEMEKLKSDVEMLMKRKEV